MDSLFAVFERSLRYRKSFLVSIDTLKLKQEAANIHTVGVFFWLL